MAWCFFIIIFNYSIIAYWVWNPDGWLHKLNFIDCAGSGVIHITGAVCGLVAVYFLGPRNSNLSKDGKLKTPEAAHRPIIVALGTFILWFGWFAFNLSSPIASNVEIGHFLGTVCLNTMVAPSSAVLTCFLIMKYTDQNISFEHLVSCILCGLVAITAGCYTVPVWAAMIIGFCVSPVYFVTIHVERNVFQIDDPLQIGTLF